MSAVEKLLAQLKDRQVAFAVEALGIVRQRDAFEFGRLHGVISGLKMAEGLLEEILGEDDVGTKSSQSR